MRASDNYEQELDVKLTHALEQAPTVAVPEDFTQRVMAALPERKWSPQMVRSRYGRNIGIACAVLLACALVLLIIVRPQNEFLSLAVEPLLALQLGGLLFWFAIRRETSA